MALLGAVALGFGSLAGYVYLRASQGIVIAAAIIGIVYSLFAILIGALAIVRRRADRLVRSAASVPTENSNSPFQSLDGRRSQRPTSTACGVAARVRVVAIAIFRDRAYRGLHRWPETSHLELKFIS